MNHLEMAEEHIRHASEHAKNLNALRSALRDTDDTLNLIERTLADMTSALHHLAGAIRELR